MKSQFKVDSRSSSLIPLTSYTCSKSITNDVVSSPGLEIHALSSTPSLMNSKGWASLEIRYFSVSSLPSPSFCTQYNGLLFFRAGWVSGHRQEFSIRTSGNVKSYINRISLQRKWSSPCCILHGLIYSPVTYLLVRTVVKICISSMYPTYCWSPAQILNWEKVNAGPWMSTLRCFNY